MCSSRTKQLPPSQPELNVEALIRPLELDPGRLIAADMTSAAPEAPFIETCVILLVATNTAAATLHRTSVTMATRVATSSTLDAHPCVFVYVLTR